MQEIWPLSNIHTAFFLGTASLTTSLESYALRTFRPRNFLVLAIYSSVRWHFPLITTKMTPEVSSVWLQTTSRLIFEVDRQKEMKRSYWWKLLVNGIILVFQLRSAEFERKRDFENLGVTALSVKTTAWSR